MDKNTAAKPASAAQTISLLLEISRLDTLYGDLYFQRAHQLIEPLLSQSAYARMKQGLTSIVLVERQLRAAVELGEWSRAREMTERIRGIQGAAAASAEWMKYAEALYDGAADIPIDPFSPGFHVFAGCSGQRLQEWQDRAIAILSTLRRTDDSKKDFYARRESDFEALSIAAPADLPGENAAKANTGQLQLEALEALDKGNLSQLDQIVIKLMEKSVAKKEQESTEAKPAETAELGDDLRYSFSGETLAGAGRLGLAPLRTESRRHLAYLIPYSWQPSFLKDEIRLRSKEQVARLTYPSGTADQMKETIEFYLLNPFITSGGTRYLVPLVVEDLLIEDFTEPEPKQDMPLSELLRALGLESRWGLSRIDIENVLLQHGPRILEEELKLDPEAFRLVVIPPDIFTYFGPERGWGQKEMWNHFEGYRVREGGKLRALAGGDKRFGGPHDLVSFNPAFTRDTLLTRFAVVQRKRMKTWHRK
ncbi:MAG TPA: hypothetical protein VNO24_25470 [Blastocatellia bacterium]|nr:hypothetical protein [Blastocatellia bacterium]